MEPLDIELYKTLKAESAAYQDKLQSLWLQKLTLSGGVAAFVIVRPEAITALQPYSPVLVGLGVLLVLAITIDFKVVEYGLHGRSISRFIQRHFAEAPRAAQWEALLWGAGPASERPLVLFRSGLTIWSAALPTLVLLIAANGLLARSPALAMLRLVAPLAMVAYLLAVSVATWSVFRRAPGD